MLFLILDEDVGSMKSLQRQLPFSHSVLKQPNRFKRQELLQHANADHVNAVSELVLNLLKKQPPIMAKLHPYKKVLRNLGRRQHSMKKRRQWLILQKRERIVARCSQVMSMCSTTTSLKLATWVSRLQDANRE